MDDTRIALQLGPLSVRWYGVLIAIGMILAIWLGAKEAKRKGLDPQLIWDGALWVIVCGLIGARLYHVISSPNDGSGSGMAYYLQNPLKIIAIWEGGLGIFGGIIGGLIGLLIYLRRRKAPVAPYLDALAPGVLLAQAIGRWGNFFNQELYGPPTGSTWWGVLIGPQFRVRAGQYDFTDLGRYPPDTRFHPTFLYESIWNLIGFAVLMSAARRFGPRLKDGDVAGLYLIWYGAGRMWVELLFRPDAWTLGALPTAAWVSLGLIAAGIAILVLNRERAGKRPEAVTSTAAEG